MVNFEVQGSCQGDGSRVLVDGEEAVPVAPSDAVSHLGACVEEEDDELEREREEITGIKCGAKGTNMRKVGRKRVRLA